MSRIHDALKKAEEETAAMRAAEATTSEGLGSPAKNASAVPSSKLSSAVSSEDFSRSIISSPNALKCLRFDDLREHCAHLEWHPNLLVDVFSNPAAGAHTAEQFRTLRSRLCLMRGSSGQSLNSLVVTSALPREGKSFVATNLAYALARQPDRRALLIDADLRSPHLHTNLGAPPSPGLSDYLKGDADEAAILQHGRDKNLFFIPAGNAITNPSELIANGKIKQLLDGVTPIFDWVILDSPPCLPVADVSVIAKSCSGVVLVIRAGTTPSAMALKAHQELRSTNVVGVVLNAVEQKEAYGLHIYHDYAYSNRDSVAEQAAT